MKTLILTLLFSFSAFSHYGVDNRMDFYDIKDKSLKEVARAVAFQTFRDDSMGWDFNRYWTMKTTTMEDKGLCTDERFLQQPTFTRNTCSAVLISPKHVLTAGNCITEHYCKNDLYYWQFNYLLEEDSFDSRQAKANFYQCEKIVSRVFRPSTLESYAIIELKKEVKDIKPIKLATTEPKIGDELIVMGHDFSMPLKIAFDTQIKRLESGIMLINSDIAGENKGSVLLNEEYELVGILVGGNESYQFGAMGCYTTIKKHHDNPRELGLSIFNIEELSEFR